MSFHEKSAIVMIGALVLVFGAYFVLFARPLLESGGSLAASVAVVMAMLVPLIAFIALGHGLIAVFMQKGDDRADERERLIALKAERNGGFALGACVFGVITWLVFGATPFLAANALLAAMVISELTSLVSKLVYYRRGL